jgi:hypothetical protein
VRRFLRGRILPRSKPIVLTWMWMAHDCASVTRLPAGKGSTIVEVQEEGPRDTLKRRPTRPSDGAQMVEDG